jgi:hypothetical protein
MKEALVAEAGGACVLCGYSRYLGALEFHHLDPSAKRFAIAGRGFTRSFADARDEAKKCVLLCGNCHAEVEAGMATTAFAELSAPLPSGDRRPSHLRQLPGLDSNQQPFD